jgi:hypothetical protein
VTERRVDLDRLREVGGEPTPGWNAKVWERIERRYRRHTIIWVVIVAVFVAIAAGVIGCVVGIAIALERWP